MKRTTTSKPRIDAAKLAAALAAAPEAAVHDRDNPPTQASDWDGAIVSHSLPELRKKLTQRRTRGPGKKPVRTPIQLRLSPDVLARWKATGKGWQTRMVERLSRV